MVLPIRPNGLPLPELANNARIGANKASGASGTNAVAGESTDFSAKLREVLNDANDTQVKAEKVAEDYASGKQNDLHGTMISMAQADVSLRLVANVRNRAIEAYREIMRMGS